MWKKVRNLLIPVLMGIYPGLAMFANNISSVNFGQVLRLLFFSVVLAVVVIAILLVIFRDSAKASLIASCWLIVFFYYGHFYNLVQGLFGAHVGRHIFLLPLAFAIIVGSVVLIWKFVHTPAGLISLLGYIVAILMLMTSYTIIVHYWSVAQAKSTSLRISSSVNTDSMVEKPNIYYIILDGHGRQDIMQNLYGYDDSHFIQFLKNKGFYVADSSHSNYDQTFLSLSSSLNLNYLNAIGLDVDPSRPMNRELLADRIKHSLVRQILAKQGYQTIAFSNGWDTAMTDADVYFDFSKTAEAVRIDKAISYREFEKLFFSTTLLRVWIDRGWLPAMSEKQQPVKYHYMEIKYTLTSLAMIPEMPGNYFIFAHIMAPHPPFVFGSDGRLVDSPFGYGFNDGINFKGTADEYIVAYRAQATYIDHEVESLITTILSSSRQQPIIIIQGDHGPGAYLNQESLEKTNLDERMSILNAYYFPGAHESRLYPTISPVNTFRILFDEYFKMNYGLLPDKNYYSKWSHPFDFTDITNKLEK
jgi:hypothetical protein